MLELEFLREVDTRGDLYTKEVVHRAVYRSDNHLIQCMEIFRCDTWKCNMSLNMWQFYTVIFVLEKAKWTYCEAYLWNPIWSLLKGVFKHGKLCKLKTVVSHKFQILRSIRAGSMLKGMPRFVQITINMDGWRWSHPQLSAPKSRQISANKSWEEKNPFSFEKFLFWMVFHTQYCVKIIRLSHEQTPTSIVFQFWVR